MKIQQTSLFSIAPLFLVLFIDGMGLGLLFPILNSLLVDPKTAFLIGDYAAQMRQFFYGVVIAVFMIAWFFGASILGDLSDTIGRKKSLLICLIGATLGYFVSALAIPLHSISLLVTGRVIAGFTAGSQPIAQAAIVDVSNKENKGRNMGFMLLSLSLGFLLGPVIGGILSHSAFVSWFHFSTPLYFAALISFLNIILLLMMFHETHLIQNKIKIKLSSAIRVFMSAFSHSQVRSLSGILLLMVFGWGSYFSFIATFLFNRYGFNSLENALFLSLIAMGFSIGSGFFVSYCNQHFSLRFSIGISYLIGSMCALLTWLFHDIPLACIAGVVMGSAIAVGYSNILTLFSNQVNENEQGWVMGVTGSIGAICFGLTSLLGGVVSFVGFTAPLIIAFLGLVLAGILIFCIEIQSENEQKIQSMNEVV